jgi:hypothetical protein
MNSLDIADILNVVGNDHPITQSNIVRQRTPVSNNQNGSIALRNAPRIGSVTQSQSQQFEDQNIQHVQDVMSPSDPVKSASSGEGMTNTIEHVVKQNKDMINGMIKRIAQNNSHNKKQSVKFQDMENIAETDITGENDKIIPPVSTNINGLVTMFGYQIPQSTIYMIIILSFIAIIIYFMSGEKKKKEKEKEKAKI